MENFNIKFNKKIIIKIVNTITPKDLKTLLTNYDSIIIIILIIQILQKYFKINLKFIKIILILKIQPKIIYRFKIIFKINIKKRGG